MTRGEQDLFPMAYGIETERTINVDSDALRADDMRDVMRRMPTVGDTMHRRIWLKNGGCCYIDCTPQNINAATYGVHEDNTPECVSIVQAISYARANQQLTEDAAFEFTKDKTRDGNSHTVRLQQRVMAPNKIDADGDFKGLPATLGSHDNFGYGSQEVASIQYAADTNQLLNIFLATRRMLVGSGYVDGNGDYSVSQKTDLEYFRLADAYQFKNKDNDARVEIRDSNINFSDWAATVRMGGAAVALALCGSPLLDEIAITNDLAHLHTYIPGTLGTGDPELVGLQISGLRYQQHLAEVVLTRLVDITDIPIEISVVAHNIIAFSDMCVQYLLGNLPLSKLASRADWAAKLQILERANDRSLEKYGIPLTTAQRQALDMRYDATIGTFTPKGDYTIKRPLATTLKERGDFIDAIPSELVTKSMSEAPSDTAASLRTRLLKTHGGYAEDWDRVHITSPTGVPHSFSFASPLTRTPSKQQMAYFKRQGIELA